MSFSSDVKDELVKHIGAARHCQLAELSAIMHFVGQYGQEKDGRITIGFETENPELVRKGFTLLKKTFNIDSGVSVSVKEVADLTEKLGELDGPVSRVMLKSTCCKRAFLRGAFLSVGSISDPSKGYHLELSCPNAVIAKELVEIIGEFDIEARLIQRKKYYVVYIKESECISELLSIIEAPKALMDLENTRILKEVRNRVNRNVNCEMANISKTVNASKRQIEDIIFIRDHIGFSNLPASLREMAEVRLENPEVALKDLGALLNPPVGKSGVNHRLRKLSEICEKNRL